MPVYFARAGGRVKIGWARDERRRLAAVQLGSSDAVEIVRTVDGPRSLETAFHRHYVSQHLRGEWFRWSDDMLITMPDWKPAERTPLHEAVDICGGQTALARKIGKRQSVISMGLHRGKIPADICPLIETATGGQITRQMLRPDFPWAA